MPIATIDLLDGYDAAAKARLGRDVTLAIGGVIAAPPEAITVILRDMPQDNYFRGGSHRQPAPVLPDGAKVVQAYLAAMEARDLPAARALLAPGFAMTFPGGITMTTLEELIAWSAPRYRFVKKTYERFDAMGQHVYCFGTLHGEWPDGTAFSGIRFIDRFELAGGLIQRQDVWNDMGEVRGK
jgi:phenylpyruvate tautomerase PptA (4-oxalocrotonate tautomerase family)